MKRVVVFVYGLLTYIMFLGVFLYAIGFVGNMIVPKSIDSGVPGPLSTALLINALILGLFAVQHTIMARPSFKALLTRLIPSAAERPTFVLATNLILILLFWQWRPLTQIVWQVDNAAGAMILDLIFWAGWAIVLVATFLIDHFELFGLKQVIGYLQNKETPAPHFQIRSLYKLIRHPIMLGFLIAFWATPTMTMGHLLFTLLTTGYIFVGLFFEERDLRTRHGAAYLEYVNRVPMLIPFTNLGGSRGPGSRDDQIGLANQPD